MQCQCPAAGFCHVLQRRMSAHHHAICQHKVLTPAKCEVYQQNWQQLATAQAASNDPTGPGSKLKELLAELGIKNFAGCGCASRMRQMNRWGVVGCRENFAAIRGWIAEAQAKAGWSATLTAATRATTSGLALQIDPLDIPGSLVRIAINRAAADTICTAAPKKSSAATA